MRRIGPALAILVVLLLAAAPAEGGGASTSGCGAHSYSYAGLQADSKAHGIAATLAALSAPEVTDGHIGGWVGLGGVDEGPGGQSEWIQAGLAAFTSDGASQAYYEVTVAGSAPRYVELASSVAPGVAHRFSVLEMANREDWWRVWLDGEPVSPPIHLPGSDGKWYPQAVAENWNGNVGACNGFDYQFENVSLAATNGGVWRPLGASSEFQDPGYHVVPVSQKPRTFLASSLAV
jgi:hypothetical protein